MKSNMFGCSTDPTEQISMIFFIVHAYNSHESIIPNKHVTNIKNQILVTLKV